MFFVHVGALVVHTSVEVSRRQLVMCILRHFRRLTDVYRYVKYESNKYLDEMNEKFFKPHGLYALVMAYQPESDEIVQEVDLNTNVLTSIASREGPKPSRFANFSGKTREIEIP